MTLFAISDPQSKRRSEEPLFKIIHKLVDETDEPVIEEGDNKENQCKENINVGNSKENEFKESNAKNEEVVSKEEEAEEEAEEEEEGEWEVEEIVDYKYDKRKKEGLDEKVVTQLFFLNIDEISLMHRF